MEARAAQHAASVVAGDGIVRANLGALSLEPRREHEARRLPDVVGVGLEGHPEQRDLAPHE